MIKTREISKGVRFGQRYGRLVVAGIPFSAGSKRWRVVCECDCGTINAPFTESLQRGTSKSCGCRKASSTRITSVNHNYAGRRDRHPLYRVWSSMIQRCHNPRDSSYGRYGAKGVCVCDEWRGDAQAFIEWSLASGYERGLQIDRIDSTDGYRPGNCRFVTQKQNSRRVHYHSGVVIEHMGRSLSITEWSNLTGISETTIRRRIAYGLPSAEILAPTQRSKRRAIA